MRGSDRPDLTDRLEYAALTSVLAVLRASGTEGSGILARGLGRFVARCVPLRRRVALENLALAFPDSTDGERRAIYRSMIENLGAVLGDFARMVGSPAAVRDALVMDHPEYIRELHETGGGITLTAHYGNWEALGAAAVSLGDTTMLGARQRNPLVERMFSEYRARLGVEAVSVRSGLRPVVRALKRGRVVASLADQDGGRDGYFIDFFGRPASVQPGLFRLAARLGVPVVAGFALRTEDGWRGEIHPPWRPAPAEGEKAVEREARKLAVAFTRLVEEYVRRRPDHWFWVHRRWKTRPPGEAQTTPPRGR